MKTNNLLTIGLIGLGAYLLLAKKGTATTENVQSGQQYNPTDRFNQEAAKAGITPDKAIKVLNEDAANSNLKRTSETIAKNITYTTPDGVTRTGNIAQLGTGAKVAVSVTPAIKDKQGQTGLDKMIAANKIGKTSSQLARKATV